MAAEPTVVLGENIKDKPGIESAVVEVEANSNEPVAEDQAGQTELAGLKDLTFVPDRSEARFLIDEVLLGADKTVVDATSQITGTISVDPSDPANAEISTIPIDARDITPDNNRRNRSIQRQIFRSALDENRYMTFEPASIVGMPEVVNIGESFLCTVDRILTVRGETQPVTFELAVTPLSSDQISGLATATVRYADFGITIPSVPAVASVEDEVCLESGTTGKAGGLKL